ncbi:borealin-2 isoform X2 [Vanacampus margaritifer]
MAPKRSRNAVKVQHEDELHRTLRCRKMKLFLQQFEKEAQERMNELVNWTENSLANVDKVFYVELKKLPSSILDTRVVDLIELSATKEVFAMQKQESTETMQRTRRGVPNRRGKSVDPVQSSLTRKNSCKTSKWPIDAKSTSGSISSGNLRASASGVTGGRLRKPSYETAKPKPKLRHVVSAGDLECSGAGSAAHITVTTGRGQTMCVSEANKDNINFDLLDDVALRRMQELSKLIEYMSGKGRSHR